MWKVPVASFADGMEVFMVLGVSPPPGGGVGSLRAPLALRCWGFPNTAYGALQDPYAVGNKKIQ